MTEEPLTWIILGAMVWTTLILLLTLLIAIRDGDILDAILDGACQLLVNVLYLVRIYK